LDSITEMVDQFLHHALCEKREPLLPTAALRP
jgi:hypothetical protein